MSPEGQCIVNLNAKKAIWEIFSLIKAPDEGAQPPPISIPIAPNPCLGGWFTRRSRVLECGEEDRMVRATERGRCLRDYFPREVRKNQVEQVCAPCWLSAMPRIEDGGQHALLPGIRQQHLFWHCQASLCSAHTH